MQRLKLFFPLLVFAVIGLFFYVMIERIGSGDYDPQSLPSALNNRPFPAFSLPILEAEDKRVSQSDMLGHIALVNVWATWCPTCHIEHPYLLELAREHGVVIFGVNYKDDRQLALDWLRDKGNPYQFTVFDQAGKLGLDMGVTGAPETYLIDHRGFVRLRFQGALSAAVWIEKFLPLITQLEREASADTGSEAG